MPPPRATDLLDAWDAGLHSSSARRALLLLATARPDPIDQLAAMPLGQVAAELLRLHASLFGPTLVCLADCRSCGTVVESEVGSLAWTRNGAGSSGTPLMRTSKCRCGPVA